MSRPSKAQIAARKQRAALARRDERNEREHREAILGTAPHSTNADRILVSCEGCGLEQVSSDRPCVLCGCEYARYAGPCPTVVLPEVLASHDETRAPTRRPLRPRQDRRTKRRRRRR